MNVFGHIGQFILKYQVAIQWVAICIGVALGIFVIYKIVKSAKRNNETMVKISKSLDELNTNIMELNKHGDMIYIDNCSRPNEGEIVQDSAPQMKAESRKEYYTQEEIVEKLHAMSEKKQSVMDSIERAGTKYLSRDEATDKQGRTYTIEEIEAIIRD